MICLQRQFGWEIMFQRSHAGMAAQLLHHWRADERPTFWVELLMACAQHDNGWTEWEPGGRLSESGAPIDFRLAYLEHILIQAKRVVALASHQDACVGWLISRHMHHLYDGRRGELAELDTWLTEKERERGRQQEVCGHSTEELEHAYAMLLWCDTLSLMLCEEALPFGAREVEVEALPSGQKVRAIAAGEVGENRVAVWPWPFGEHTAEVRVHAESYEITQLAFDDHDAFLAHAMGADQKRVVWTVVCAQGGEALGDRPLDELSKQELAGRCEAAGLYFSSRTTKRELAGQYSAHLGHLAYEKHAL